MIQIAFAFFQKLLSIRSFGNACHSLVPTLLPRLEKVVWGGVHGNDRRHLNVIAISSDGMGVWGQGVKLQMPNNNEKKNSEQKKNLNTLYMIIYFSVLVVCKYINLTFFNIIVCYNTKRIILF